MLDRFDSLFNHFSISASVFHAGPLCGLTDERAIEGTGHLHLIQRGLVEVQHDHHATLHIVEPSLLFYPRPLAHRFRTDRHSGADFVCATVAFNAGRLNPVMRALPSVLAMPLAAMPEMRATLDVLFYEALAQRYGWQSTINRLFEVLLIQLLRKIVDEGMMSTGMLAGLAHPQVGKAMTALHEAPAQPWTLENLAAVAGVSRSHFANAFKATMGSTVGDYLCEWRMALAQELLRCDKPLKLIAAEVGYGSPVALARAFKARLGMSPRAWRQSQQPAALHAGDASPSPRFQQAMLS